MLANQPCVIRSLSDICYNCFLIFINQSISLSLSRKFAKKESKLLDSIGSSNMEQELERRVMKITKDTSDRREGQTGVQASLTEE
jgi:hypothetical protein